MKYISDGHTLPEVIHNWLETTLMQEEFKKFISIDVDETKSNLLINCLKLKGTFFRILFINNKFIKIGFF